MIKCMGRESKEKLNQLIKLERQIFLSLILFAFNIYSREIIIVNIAIGKKIKEF